MSSRNIHERNLEIARLAADALVAKKGALSKLVKVRLIGSVAKNEDGLKSDIDVLITHEGPKELFPFPFVEAIWGSLEEAKLPLRPSHTRRSQKFPGAVHPFIRPEELFLNPNSIPADDFRLEREWMEAVITWTTIFVEAVELYPEKI